MKLYSVISGMTSTAFLVGCDLTLHSIELCVCPTSPACSLLPVSVCVCVSLCACVSFHTLS